MRRMRREELQGAPYNPRTITPQAKRALRANLETVGLLGPVVWNERTGLVVGGHQRLASLDALEGRSDYLLDVSVVSLDEKAEREQNVFLNNANTQGTWDLDALGALLKGDDFDIAASGFTPDDVYQMFDDTELLAKAGFAPEEPAQAAQFREDVEERTTTPQPQRDRSRELDDESDDSEAIPERLRDSARTHRDGPDGDDAYDASSGAAGSAGQPQVIAVFESRADRELFVSSLGLSEEERYVDGARLLTFLKL